MKTLKLLLPIMTISVIASGQNAFFRQGKSHYEKSEYREALYFLNKASKKDPLNAELFKMRGNCFYELNQIDSAEMDYLHALELSDKFPELYYNLSNVARQRQDTTKAEAYMRKFVRTKPDDADGLFQLSVILRQKASDSSFYFLNAAYKLDSLNQYIYSTYAWELFSRREYDKAFRMATQARGKFGLTNDLRSLEAYASFCVGKFNNTIQITDSLLLRQPQDISLHVLRVKARMLEASSPQTYQQSAFTFKLTEVSQDMKSLDDLVSDNTSRYYFPSLMEKFMNDPRRMSLPEFFMVYYGYTTSYKYSPYGHIGSTLLKSIDENTSLEQVMKTYQDALKMDPFNLQTYESLASAAIEAKEMEEFELALTRYIGLMEGITATGTGLSADSAYIVIAPSHEYDILNYLGLRSRMQSLHHAHGHSYDILTARDENGTEKEIYFNIDKSWESLSNSLKGGNSKKDKKKRKK